MNTNKEERIEKLTEWCAADDRASLNDLNVWDLRMIDEFYQKELVATQKETREEDIAIVEREAKTMSPSFSILLDKLAALKSLT